ncbi:type VII secretion target [Rhodococcus sp. HNM0569]|uniref:type VII secretion target n=1 Tax=Rhodococcus sp. HNM0569 TaxID=2716340 RepID=UPI00146CAC1B|nr:type VII secretion target [Rhodococcus sp. HNM0569]NLU81282.1 ESX-1 secretion-associated protein [Rhodococcus sp. HNM0569]
MSDVSVVTDGIRAYGATTAQAAEQVAAAGAFDLAANIAALTPVLGPIGADFLAAFAHAQGTHAEAVASLANFYTQTALAANASADGYDDTDAGTGSALGGLGPDMGGLA